MRYDNLFYDVSNWRLDIPIITRVITFLEFTFITLM